MAAEPLDPMAAEPVTAEPRKRSASPAARQRSGTAIKKIDGKASRLPQAIAASPAPELALLNEADDDRDNIQPGDRVLLIVENDVGFARFLLDAARLTRGSRA